MPDLSNAMDELVMRVRAASHARHTGVDQIRAGARDELARYGRERLATAGETRRGVRSRLQEIRQSLGLLRRGTRGTLCDIASDVSEARRMWARGLRGGGSSVPAPPAPVAAEPAPAKTAAPVRPNPEPPGAQREQVLLIVRAHPDGIRLVDIGNELGVDWRGLIGITKALVNERSLEKIDSLYYPAEQ